MSLPAEQNYLPWRFSLEVNGGVERSDNPQAVPIEAHFKGGRIVLELHVVDGKLAGVEQIMGPPMDMLPTPLPPVEEYDLCAWQSVTERRCSSSTDGARDAGV